MSAMSRVSTHKQPSDYSSCQCPKTKVPPSAEFSRKHQWDSKTKPPEHPSAVGAWLTVLLSWPLPLCAQVLSDHHSPSPSSLGPQQLLMEPSLMTCAGRRRRDGELQPPSTTFRHGPCRYHCAFGQHASKGLRLTYLFNFDYTAQLPSGNER